MLREGRPDFGISDQSVGQLASRFIVEDTSLSARVVRKELHRGVRNALDQLSPADREVLVMRHLEQMAIGEIAADLELSESAVKMRCLRAIQRLRELLVAETERTIYRTEGVRLLWSDSSEQTIRFACHSLRSTVAPSKCGSLIPVEDSRGQLNVGKTWLPVSPRRTNAGYWVASSQLTSECLAPR